MSEKIYAAINAVMNDVGVVAKTDVNSFDRYNFRGIDAVMNALSPAMIKNKVFVVPEVIESTREERQAQKDNKTMIYTTVKVRYTFYADDGSHVEAVVMGEAMDRSDKSTNKAMSAAFKYACFQTFCIPTEEFEDADKDTPIPTPKATEKRTQAVTVEGEPYPPRKVMIAAIAAKYPAGDENTQKMLAYYKVESIDKMSDVDLQVMYNRAMKK